MVAVFFETEKNYKKTFLPFAFSILVPMAAVGLKPST
jgi:hypothetical protein